MISSICVHSDCTATSNRWFSADWNKYAQVGNTNLVQFSSLWERCHDTFWALWWYEWNFLPILHLFALCQCRWACVWTHKRGGGAGVGDDGGDAVVVVVVRRNGFGTWRYAQNTNAHTHTHTQTVFAVDIWQAAHIYVKHAGALDDASSCVHIVDDFRPLAGGSLVGRGMQSYDWSVAARRESAKMENNNEHAQDSRLVIFI